MPSRPLSYQDTFARHGFAEGVPLWNPAPVSLPGGRQIDGLKIGDVGVINEDGYFEVFFNICNPPDGALEQEYGFPSSSARLREPNIIEYSAFGDGYVFSSPKTAWLHRQGDASHYIDPRTMITGPVPNAYTAYLEEDGAHILVPGGATCSKLHSRDFSLFESQANSDWSTWFDFVKNQLGRRPNTLYLITGLCRTRSWALASFNKKDDRPVEVACELVVGDGKLQVPASRWMPSGRFACKIGPRTGNQEHTNQTIFIRAFTITSDGKIMAQSSRQSRISQLLHKYRKNSNTMLAREKKVSIRHVPEVTTPFHPSDAINQYLLRKRPSAQVAITHDTIWMTMIAKGQLSRLQDLESTIDAIVSDHHSIVLRNGVVYLRHKNISLGRFGIDRSTLPFDLAGCIQQDDKHPFARYLFGNIYRGRLCTPHGSAVKVTIKVISIDDNNFSEKEKQTQRLTEEFSLLDHINVLPLIWATTESGRFTMVFPWAEKGTLTSYLDDRLGDLTDVQILTLVHDVAAGLHYLHSIDIIHGGLSGSSVVIDANGTALHSDFGLSTLVDEHWSPLFGQSERGLETVRWAAPASLAGGNKTIARSNLTKRSDIYSFGCIMLQILSGKVPYYYYERDEDVASAISRRETPKRPDNHRVKDHRWVFIQQCWALSMVDTGLSSEDLVEFANNEIKGIQTGSNSVAHLDSTIQESCDKPAQFLDESQPAHDLIQPSGTQEESSSTPHANLIRMSQEQRILVTEAQQARLETDGLIQSLRAQEESLSGSIARLEKTIQELRNELAESRRATEEQRETTKSLRSDLYAQETNTKNQIELLEQVNQRLQEKIDGLLRDLHPREQTGPTQHPRTRTPSPPSQDHQGDAVTVPKKPEHARPVRSIPFEKPVSRPKGLPDEIVETRRSDPPKWDTFLDILKAPAPPVDLTSPGPFSDPGMPLRGARATGVIDKLKALDTWQELAAHQALVRHLQFSPNGKYLATSSWDRTSVIFRVGESFTTHRILVHVRGFIGQVAWSPNSRILLTRLTRAIKVWTEGGVCKKTIDRQNTVQSIVWLPTGDAFLSVEGSEVVKLDFHGKVLDVYHLGQVGLTNVAVTPDCCRLVGVGPSITPPSGPQPSQHTRVEKRIIVYNMLTRTRESQIPFANDVRDIAMARKVTAVLLSPEKAAPQLWKLEVVRDRDRAGHELTSRLNLKHTYSLRGPVDIAGPCHFGGKDDQFVLCAGKAGDVHIWDRETAALLRYIRPLSAPGVRDLTCIAWNHATDDPMILATGNHDGTIQIYSTAPLVAQSDNSDS